MITGILVVHRRINKHRHAALSVWWGRCVSKCYVIFGGGGGGGGVGGCVWFSVTERYKGVGRCLIFFYKSSSL